MHKYVLGLDFGSDSARALVVNVQTGQEESCGVALYPRWSAGRYSDAAENRFRHHPQDYLEALVECVRQALERLPSTVREKIFGIGIAATGSTPGPVDRQGVLLALQEDFAENPNAMFNVWKDHTSLDEAVRILTFCVRFFCASI